MQPVSMSVRLQHDRGGAALPQLRRTLTLRAGKRSDVVLKCSDLDITCALSSSSCFVILQSQTRCLTSQTLIFLILSGKTVPACEGQPGLLMTRVCRISTPHSVWLVKSNYYYCLIYVHT